jgi:hypothetical protein
MTGFVGRDGRWIGQPNVTQVSDAYERKVLNALDFTLPPHSDDCDRNWTSGLCLRCHVLSHVKVAFGFSRPASTGVKDAL